MRIPNAVRIAAEEIESVLDSLDACGETPPSERRSADRVRYRRTVPADVATPSGNRRGFVGVRCRNLSSQGVAFLFDRHVYPLAHCRVRLPAPGNAAHEIGAAVVRCRRIGSRLYELGVRFDQVLNLSLYTN